MKCMSPEAQSKLEQIFPQEQWSAVIALLDSECGSGLPLIGKQGAIGIERVQCAALKLSEGSMEKLGRAVQVAKEDWRDVLVAAGFGHDVTAHREWLKEGL